MTAKIDGRSEAVNTAMADLSMLALGVARSTFYTWFGRTLKLEDPLVSEDRKPALLAALAGQPWRDHDEPAFDDEASAEQGDDGDEDE